MVWKSFLQIFYFSVLTPHIFKLINFLKNLFIIAICKSIIELIKRTIKVFLTIGTLVFQKRNIYKYWSFMIVMETLFRQALGDNPKIRVLEFFIEGRELDYSISDIAEGAEIGRTTLFRIFDDLIKNKIIVPTRQIGNAKLYRLNLNNEFVRRIVAVFDDIIIPKRK